MRERDWQAPMDQEPEQEREPKRRGFEYMVTMITPGTNLFGIYVEAMDHKEAEKIALARYPNMTVFKTTVLE
jgi:hypothetical protein